MQTEPVRLVTLVTAAIQATLALLLFAGVDPEVVGGLTAAAVAWVLVGGELLARRRVTPLIRPRTSDGRLLVAVSAPANLTATDG
jgi:hypothetical protein